MKHWLRYQFLQSPPTAGLLRGQSQAETCLSTHMASSPPAGGPDRRGHQRSWANRAVCLLALLWLGLAGLASAQSIDPTFNPTDVGFGFGDGANNQVNSVAVQGDGKVLIGGYFTEYNGIARGGIARLNADGSLDMSFNPGAGANNDVLSMAVLADGKVLIGRDFIEYNSTGRDGIARLNADGTLDTSFNPGAGANNDVLSMAVLADGKVLIGGSFTEYNGIARNGIARLNANGSLDMSFDPGTGADSSTVLSVAVLADGKVLIGGQFTEYNGTGRNGIARLNADGTLDTSFNPGTGAFGTVLSTRADSSTVFSVAVLADGKVLIEGGFTEYNGTPRNYIARLNANGSVDTSFNSGTGAFGTVLSMAVLADGKVLIGGYFTSYNGIAGIARLNADGSLDTGFNPGSGTNSTVVSVAVQADGKVLIGGSFSEYNGITRNGIARLNADGSLDMSFNPGTGADRAIYSVAVDTDSKVLIGGYFTSYNGIARGGIARLNADGSLDMSFDPGAGTNNAVLSMAVLADGKVLIGGSFTEYNGTPRNGIARLNANGSVDTTGFNSGSGAFGSTVNSVAVQGDGKVLIGGYFTSYNDTPRNNIARLNADGTLDTSFNPGTGANNDVLSMAVLADGKVLIGGYFTEYNGIARNGIARLNANGSLDMSFDPGTGADSSTVLSVAVLADGKVLIGGQFTEYNGTGRNGIARLNADGTLDMSFDPGTGADSSTVFSVAVLTDSKVLIGGDFTAYNGTPRNGIARLNANGSVDTTGFNSGAGANGTVYGVAVDTDSKVLIGGDFTAYNGTPRNRIARLNNTAMVVATPAGPFSIRGVTTVSCMTANADLRQLSFSPQYGGTNGQPISFSVVNELLPTTDPGPYTLNLYTDNPVITLKAVQGGTAGEASFTYNWLAVCTGNDNSGTRQGAESIQVLEVRVLGNPVEDGEMRVEVRGGGGESLRLQLTDLRGQVLGTHVVEQAGSVETHRFGVGRAAAGMLLLQATTPTRSQSVKVLRAD